MVIMSFISIQKIKAQKARNVDYIEINIKGGNIIKGELLRQTDEFYEVKLSSSGVIKVKKSQVSSVKIDFNTNFNEDMEENDKKYYSYSSRYFICISGYNLNKGEAYYANTWIFYNDFNFGITDHFSVGAGTVPLFLFNGADSPMWLKAKLSYPIIKDKIMIAGGVIGGALVGDENISENNGIWFYGVSTFGSKSNNMTIGINVAKGFNSDFNYVFSLSGIKKVSIRTFLIMDNYFKFSQKAILTMIGARTMFKGITIDYGGVIPLSTDFDSGLYIFPYLGFKVKLFR